MAGFEGREKRWRMGKNVVSIGTELATGKKKFYNNPHMASAPFLSILEDVMSNFSSESRRKTA